MRAVFALSAVLLFSASLGSATGMFFDAEEDCCKSSRWLNGMPGLMCDTTICNGDCAAVSYNVGSSGRTIWTCTCRAVIPNVPDPPGEYEPIECCTAVKEIIVPGDLTPTFYCVDGNDECANQSKECKPNTIITTNCRCE